MNIVLFDGVCNFCNSSVNFIMARDKKDKFRFAALQSEPGTELQKKFGFDPDDLSSFILVEGASKCLIVRATIRIAPPGSFRRGPSGDTWGSL